MTPEPTPGTLLTGQALIDAVDAERIFRPGSWSAECARTASYDLRMSRDFLVIPAHDSGGKQRVYRAHEYRHTEILLEPGETALVASEERIALDWSLTAQVGPKFSQAARGLLVLTGLVVDPGYGFDQIDDEWRASEDARLHFILSNVGPQTIALRPGIERIATLMIFSSAEPTVRRVTPSAGFAIYESDYFSQGAPEEIGLTFFKNVTDISSRLDELRGVVRDSERSVAELRSRVNEVEGNTNYVVVFGVFLLAVTIFGVSLSVTLQLLPKVIAGLTPTMGRWFMLGIGAMFAISFLTFAAGIFRFSRSAPDKPARRPRRTRKT